jgi:CRP/FNR family cyclic AMP-dependent transcriptional regulator
MNTARVVPITDVWHLRNIDWLAQLGEAGLAELERGATQKRFARGEMIFAPTPTPSSIYLLQSGLTRVYRLSESGGETSLGYVTPGEVFGELSTLGEYPRDSFAQAVRPCFVWKIPRDGFRRLLGSRPMLAVEVLKQIADRLKRIENRVEDLVFRDVRTRVARMLSELESDFGRGDEGHRVIDLPITQGELATLVGATRQTVNQTLREFEEQGVVGRENRRLVLRDRAALQALARGAHEPSRSQ